MSFSSGMAIRPKNRRIRIPDFLHCGFGFLISFFLVTAATSTCASNSDIGSNECELADQLNCSASGGGTTNFK